MDVVVYLRPFHWFSISLCGAIDVKSSQVANIVLSRSGDRFCSFLKNSDMSLIIGLNLSD